MTDRYCTPAAKRPRKKRKTAHKKTLNLLLPIIPCTEFALPVSEPEFAAVSEPEFAAVSEPEFAAAPAPALALSSEFIEFFNTHGFTDRNFLKAFMQHSSKRYGPLATCLEQEFRVDDDPGRGEDRNIYLYFGGETRAGENLQATLRSCQTRFVVVAFFINIYIDGQRRVGHANMLFFDQTQKKLERFEPFGDKIMVDSTCPDELSEYCENLITETLNAIAEFIGFTYCKAPVAPDQIRQQALVMAAMDQKCTQKLQTVPSMGTCVVWCMWAITVRLANPDVPLAVTLQREAAGVCIDTILTFLEAFLWDVYQRLQIYARRVRIPVKYVQIDNLEMGDVMGIIDEETVPFTCYFKQDHNLIVCRCHNPPPHQTVQIPRRILSNEFIQRFLA